MPGTLPPLVDFMPHRPPMLLLDHLVEHTETLAVCTKTLRADDPFVADGEVSSVLALELFAQTAAAHFGYLAHQRGGGFAAGALLGTRRLDLDVPRLRVGDTLEIRATQVMAMPPASQYECVMLRDGLEIARGAINVAMGAMEDR
jgi:predicted hotdog family 3-hydroxylacyl-ACP dehydratase